MHQAEVMSVYRRASKVLEVIVDVSVVVLVMHDALGAQASDRCRVQIR